MRVIAGTARGTKLLAVPGDTTRPILDRVKTSLFDILRPRIEGMTWLDVFGGSGSVAIEALSQGAAKATILDIEPKAVTTIKKNLELTHLTDRAEVRQTDCFTYLRNCQKSFDFIFVAPPQYKNMWIEAAQTIAERPELLNTGGQMIIQIDPKEYEVLGLSTLSEAESRKYGNTLLVFFDRLP